MRLSLFPASASTFAPRSDMLFYVLLAITGTIAVAITIFIITFAVRYRQGSAVNRERPRNAPTTIEVIWIVAPLVILMAVFFWSFVLFSSLYEVPSQSLSIYVLGKQWMWKAEHLNGIREINQLHVPLGMPVQLIMTSQDVIHSFYVPAFRIKQDVLPGRYTSLWFTATKTGQFFMFCAEYCGTDHSHMGGNIVVMPRSQYEEWLNQSAVNLNLSQRGFELFKQHGCDQCHSSQAKVRAPSLEDIYGNTVQLDDGRTVLADESYLRDSIMLPNKQVVAGYKAIMPTYQDQLSEEDVMALIAYMKGTTTVEGHAQ